MSGAASDCPAKGYEQVLGLHISLYVEIERQITYADRLHPTDNILEWPAAVFPTGLKVDEDLDKMKGPEPTNETERDLHSICKQTVQNLIPRDNQLI